MRRLLALVPLLTAMLIAAPAGDAVGGHVAFDGGTPAERAQVLSALAASNFNWNVLPQVVVHIAENTDSFATPGEVWLDAHLLDAGRFAWGVVQHEFGHQVDFLLLTDTDRARFERLLGAKTWCDRTKDLPHGAYGCERFASTLAWAYWPRHDNCMRPASSRDESAAMSPGAFRLELERTLAHDVFKS